MVAGGKKAKAKDKTGKAGTKQKKKAKNTETTDDQTTVSESPLPSSPVLLVLREYQGLQPQESEIEPSPTPSVKEPSQYAAANYEDHIAQSACPDPISGRQPTVSDDQTDIEVTELPALDKSSRSPTPAEGTEEGHIPDEQNDLVGSTEQTPNTTPPAAPFSPVPALVPLPSPSLTEARFMSSPCQENHCYHAMSPGFAPYASPVPKFTSPLVRAHFPPITSANETPPPSVPMTPTAPPSTAPSFATAYHSPMMSSAGVMPPYAPYPPHPASIPAIRDLPLTCGQTNENETTSLPETDNEHIELLQRIQSAIPDINRLLHGFKHTHSKLSSREAEIRQLGNQHEQALMHKDFYIEALQAQMRKTANESAEECAKLKTTINELRLELGNLQEKQKDLEDSLAAQQNSNEELSQTKVDLETQISKLITGLQEARDHHEKEQENLKEERERALAAQKQELTELFEEIKSEDEKAAAEALQAQEKELLDQHETEKGEWDKERAEMQRMLELENKVLEATKAELASKIAELDSKDADMAARLAELTSARENVATKLSELEEKQKELEETREQNARGLQELHEGHACELHTLRQTHEEQLDAATKELEDRTAALEAQGHEKEQHWAGERAALEKQLAEKESELTSSEREKERLEGEATIREQQLQRAFDEMRSTIDHLDRDCDRLRKTLHSLGEATDLKSTKGDQFFLDCFTQLAQMIFALSKEHFAYLPIDPPKDILSKIPSEIPSFLGNTPASRELRCAYVQHVVSKTLTYRVFQPFLFTLGRRYDKADTFFQMLSIDIRHKSVRREAFWRQQTLKAAYTTSDAKQSINVAAAVIVDEIIDHLKHFADPKHLDSLLTGVRKIVKLAAETWRHARVERELVLATFPAPDAESVSNDAWQEYRAVTTDLSHSPAANDPGRHIVLRTFPRILREAAHEDFATGEERACACIYSPGVALYSDSTVVMARLEELARKSDETLVGDQGQTSSTTPHKSLAISKGVEGLALSNGSPVTLAVKCAAATSLSAQGLMKT